MTDIVPARINAVADQIAAEGMILRAADVRAGAVEIERLTGAYEEMSKMWRASNARILELIAVNDDNERLRGVLKLADVALDTAECVIDADDEVEAFHQVQAARKAVRRALEPKP